MSQDGHALTMGGGTPTPSSSPLSGASSVSSEGAGCGGLSPPSPITLAVPRPEHQRSTNVYVDTPFQHRVLPRREEEPSVAQGSRNPQDLPLVHGSSFRASLHRPHAKKTTGPGTPHETTTLQKSKRGTNVVVTQPPPLTFTKSGSEEDSIICGRCGRCRCQACSTPRPSSGTWMCGGKCHLSPANAVDYVSCLCCVKGVLYHCGKDTEEDSPSVDRPCSCSGNDTFIRWTCLALAVIPLPCLLCYWPLTGLRTLCEKTYQRFTTQGCRCVPSTAHSPTPPRRIQPPPPPPEKRLLHDCV